MENLGKEIFEHYQKYLGEMIGADSFPDYDLQLMGYQDAIADCLTFATMGLSLHKKELGTCCEAVLTTETDLDACADIFVKVLCYLIDTGLPMGPGLAIGGIDGLNPDFYAAHHKSALYFTETTMFADSFRAVGDSCRIYMAFFISPEEEVLLKEKGMDAFEELLEQNRADIINLDRPSVAE